MNRVTYLGELEQLLLWVVLRLEDGAYGVAVRRELEERVGRSISRGTVYITLERLETKGYLWARMGDPSPTRGGRAKRFYALTEDGKAQLARSREALIRVWAGLESAVSS